jgi:thiopeptide-type bacteriocin biosynthesis protein
MLRYEKREIPLMEALDEEEGIGFDTGSDPAPLLKGLNLSPKLLESTPWGAREKLLLQKLGEALRTKVGEIILTPRDLENLAAPTLDPLPDAFAALVTLAASSSAEIERGNFRIIFGNILGPSGARWLGRFCHADPQLRRHVEEHLRAEEALHPDAIFAEIVHLPDGAVGFLCRPELRPYEIAYLGRSSVDAPNQIPVTDLRVSVRDGRVILRSLRSGREIIPRLTAAHHSEQSNLGVYKFLSTLPMQGVAGYVKWSWGALSDAEYLPRVVTGRIVLCRAQWRIREEALKGFRKLSGSALFCVVQQWRDKMQLPRWVAVADSDNLLPVDLDNVLSVEMLVHLIRGRQEALLTEMTDDLVASGPEGKFTHELIVPFIRTNPARSRVQSHRLESSIQEATRTFPPGAEWLYAKVYCGDVAVDELLIQTIAPFVGQVLGSGAADQWFFIRYADPDVHLRIRFHGKTERLNSEILPALQAKLSPLVGGGVLRSWQVDTYEREVERYGGSEGILIAERFFQLDSEAVLEILPLLEEGDAGLDERWRLGLRGMDALLTDFGYDLNRKREFCEEMPEHLVGRFHIDRDLKDELSRKFRGERASLEQVLNPDNDVDSPLRPGLDVLRKRSERIIPLVKNLRALEETGRLLVSLNQLLASYIHMYLNRLLRSAQPEQEFVIYDFLSRLYRSRTDQ